MITKNKHFIEKIAELENLARQYSEQDVKWRVAMFIRRFHKPYRKGEWIAVGGEVDRTFVKTVKKEARELYDYFAETTHIDANPQGEKVDLYHMAATMSALFYKTDALDGEFTQLKRMIGYQFMPEAYLDDMAGWAGDLQTLMNEVDNSPEAHETYDEFRRVFQSKLAMPGTCFSLEDMYADVDAYNIYVLAEQGTLAQAFSDYYETGYQTRFTTFTEYRSQKEIEERVEIFTKETFLGNRFPLFEENDAKSDRILHTYSKEQSAAARDGFVEYIMTQIEREKKDADFN